MSNSPIRILQFTDTHLYADPASELCGLNTDASLHAILELAVSNDWPADLVLTTGDLSQDETENAYRRFHDIFSTLQVPVYCLPGNHDDPALMFRVLSNELIQVGRHVKKGNWQIVMLNSVIPKENAGHLEKSELEFLDAALASEPKKHALVCLHHNPISLDSRWLDTMMLNNADNFFKVIDRFPNVRAISWGHVHQEYFSKRKNAVMMATPSTSIQFLPKSKNFGIDTAAPGYRWIQLFDDGSLKTGVRRLPDFSFTPDLSSKGY